MVKWHGNMIAQMHSPSSWPLVGVVQNRGCRTNAGSAEWISHSLRISCKLVAYGVEALVLECTNL
jgi:hypothetical protein